MPPAAAPFLFVGDGSDPGLAGVLVQAGLPVVDGVHFQAPGFARLPFGRAAEAHSELDQALSGSPLLRRVTGVAAADAGLSATAAASVQGQLQFVLPWILSTFIHAIAVQGTARSSSPTSGRRSWHRSRTAGRVSSMLDLLIRGATVYPGDAPPFVGDVGVERATSRS